MTFASRNTGAARLGVALLILVMYGMAMAAMVSASIPPENKEVFVVLVGGLNTALGGVVGYFFNVATRRSNSP